MSRRRRSIPAQTSPAADLTGAVAANARRGTTFEAAAARKALAMARAPTIFEPFGRVTGNRPAAVPLARVELGPPRRQEPSIIGQRDTLEVFEPYEQPRDGCKGRPADSKGNGGSRPFVPWCQKGRKS